MEKSLNEFREEILTAMENRASHLRKGQFVFNYINENYGVARYVQFIDGIDCFYNDDVIDQFIDKCYVTMVAAEQNGKLF